MKINPSEITKLIKDEIKNFGEKAEVSEIGKVLTVGDGIARVHGLDNVQAGNDRVFDGLGMALNLESDSVYCKFWKIKRSKGRYSQRTNSIVDVPVGKTLLGRVVDALENLLMERALDKGQKKS